MSIKFRAKHKSGFVVDILEPFTFPGGEAHIKGFDTLKISDYEYFVADVRRGSAQDLIHARLWSDGLLDAFARERGFDSEDELLDALWDEEVPDITREDLPKTYLFLPYLPAARADRGIPFSARGYADIINGVAAEAVIGVDPHSPVMPSLIHYFHEMPFERIIKKYIQDATSDSMSQPYDGVIAPDKGAVERATRAAKVMGVPVYTAGKSRDFDTGKLSGFHMEDELPETGRFLIVDDVCDGAGTFLGLANAIREASSNVELDLWVSHGIFSNETNFKRMVDEVFGVVHTTNSFFDLDTFGESVPGVYRRINAGKLVIHDITPFLYNEINLIGKAENE